MIHEEKTHAIIGAAMEVYRHLGPGHYEALRPQAAEQAANQRLNSWRASKPGQANFTTNTAAKTRSRR